MKSMIEKLAANATQDNIDSYIAGMTQFRNDLLQAHAEYAELENDRDSLKHDLLSLNESYTELESWNAELVEVLTEIVNRTHLPEATFIKRAKAVLNQKQPFKVRPEKIGTKTPEPTND